MASGRAEVNQRPASPFGQKTCNVRDSDFHFERRGHAVQGFQAVILRVLAVRVQVDKTRGDDETSRIDRSCSAQPLGRKADDAPSTDPDVHNGVQSGLGVHDTAALDNKVIGRLKRGQQRKGCSYEHIPPDLVT